jgi:hypothetical protein
MKVSKEWRKLTRDQRRAWNAWAKSNKVLLDDGTVRRVSGRKAMTMVLRNRAIAGDAPNPTVVPAAVTWQQNALSLRDCGPWTTNTGYVGFRAETGIAAGTKFFVWATPPVDDTEAKAHRLLRFVACLTLPAILYDELIPSFGTQYAAVHGSWDGPGEDGDWPTPKFIWFRVHHYANGQLSPGVLMRGQITVEL